MADLEKTVSILFKGVDEVSSSVNSISSSFDKFNSNVISATQPLADIAVGAEKLQAALVVMAIGGMALAVTEAGKFKSGLAEIHTLIRGTPEEVAKFDASLELYASTSTQSLEDINKAIYQAISANVDYREAIQFVYDAEKLAVAGKSTLTESVDLLTNTLAAYGASMDQAGAYSDVFFKAVEIGKLTVPELSKSISLVSPVAAATGVSIQEVSAALAALTAGGLPASTSAEYLRGALTDLVKPTVEARGEFGKLGIEFGAGELASKGFAAKMKEIWEKTGGSADAIAKLFGNVGALTSVLVLGKDSSGLYAKALEDLANASGSVDRAYAIMSNNIEYTNQRLVNSFKFALIEAGKPLLDDWGAVAKGLGDIFAGIKIGLAKGAFDEVFAAIDSFSKDAGKYFSDVAAALPDAMAAVDFTKFLSSITGLGSAVGELLKSLFGDLDLRKPEDLANAIQKVVNAITKLNEFSTGIAESLEPFFEKMGIWINKALEADTSTANLAGRTAGLGQAVNAVAGAIGMLAPALSIFSGALILDGIATIGKLGAMVGLAAGPLGWAVLAAAAIGGLFVALKELDPAAVKAFFSLGPLDNMFKSMPERMLEAKESANEFEREMQRIHAMPEVKTFTIDTETGESIEKINEMRDSILTFPKDFKVEPDLNEVTLGAISAKMNDIPKEYKILYSVGMSEGSVSVISSVKELPELTKLTIEAEVRNEESINSFMSELSKPDAKDISINLDALSFKNAEDQIQKIVNQDGSVTYMNVGVDKASIEKAKKALEEIPTEKMMEIKLQGDIDKELETIKANANNLQSAMEWTAKIDIANVEASTERMKSLLESLGSTISATSKASTDLLTADWTKMDLSQYMAALNSASDQMKMQKEAHEMQMKIASAQLRLEEAKAKRLEDNKESVIKIDSSGLEPALEMVMWQILEKVKLRANEDATQFLLGMV